jgi:NAD(P)-dependent dehydrogenase (short-subunit alcohol dehydrogenase family)
VTKPHSVGAFAGQVVLVTGASSGVGAALARAFAAAGADVALFARNEADLERVADACRETGREALVVPGDVTRPADCAALVERTIERFGRIDTVVASAGLGMWARFDELDDTSVLRRLLEVNVLGVANVFLSALPHVRSSRGMLVAISSVQGVVGVPGRSGYAASKHALQGLCDSLRIELQGTGVGVSTIVAHWVRGTNLRARALGPDGAPRGTAAPHRSRSAIDVDDVTRATLGAVRHRRRRVFVPGYLRLLPLLAVVAPSVADRLVAGRMAREGQVDHAVEQVVLVRDVVVERHGFDPQRAAELAHAEPLEAALVGEVDAGAQDAFAVERLALFARCGHVGGFLPAGVPGGTALDVRTA